MTVTFDDALKRWSYINTHIARLVDPAALRAHGIPTTSQGIGPFHSVANVHWEKMRTELNLTIRVRALKQWANKFYPQGNPFNRLMVGEFPITKAGGFILDLGIQQDIQLKRADFNQQRDRELPLPHDESIPDACIPYVCCGEEEYNLYTDPNGSTERAKIARALMIYVGGLKSTASCTAESVTAAQRNSAKMKLTMLRKLYGLRLDNESYWQYFCGELRRINSDPDNDTFVRKAYSAVFKDMAGKFEVQFIDEL